MEVPMRRLFAVIVAFSCLLLCASASASTIQLSSVPSSNMQPVCPGGYLLSMQEGDATPPAVNTRCGLSTMTGVSTLRGVFSAPSDGGSVVVSAYVSTGDRATSMALSVNGQQVGTTITLATGTRQWWSFPAVDVMAGDQIQASFTFASGSTSTVSSLHAEFAPLPTTNLASLISRDNATTQGVAGPAGDLLPEGVPSYWNWYANAIITDAFDSHQYSYANPWGQVYIASNGNSFQGPSGETLWVDVRNMNAWVLRKSTGAWAALYGGPAPTLGGALYPEDFSSGSIGGNFIRLANSEVEVSPKCAACAPATSKGYLFHLYPDAARAWVPYYDIANACSTAEVRLDPSDPILPYQPGLIANVGFDWWSSSGGGSANGAGESRFKTIGRNWRELAFCTAPVSTPPPITADPPENW